MKKLFPNISDEEAKEIEKLMNEKTFIAENGDFILDDDMPEPIFPEFGCSKEEFKKIERQNIDNLKEYLARKY